MAYAIDESSFDLFGDDTKLPKPPTPKPEPKWLAYPIVVMHLNDGTFHADVINHYKGRLNESGIMTDSHETTHMINNDIRNAHGGTTHVNAFYLGDSKAIVLPEPKMRKSAVARYVPRSLQASRFGTYITGQREWDDSPLYVYDEWTAYTNGGRTGVDAVQRNTFRESWTDGVCGLLEFCIYGTALVMAVFDNDSGYVKQNPEFIVFTNWLLRHCKDIYAKGSVMTQFKWDQQDNLLKNWRQSLDAKDMRDFMKNNMDVSWLA